jgi:Holliday junction resolvase-like predicted endonuclease
MKINKSTRHAKITGDFGEALVLYWLSKHGFKCTLADHTGIDIIARNPHTAELMGISVKSRSRSEGMEKEYLTIKNDNFKKTEDACRAFGCVPYFAFVIDAGGIVRGFLLSKNKLLTLFPQGKTASGWKMTEPYLKQYAADAEIHAFELQARTTRWWGQQERCRQARDSRSVSYRAPLPRAA